VPSEGNHSAPPAAPTPKAGGERPLQRGACQPAGRACRQRGRRCGTARKVLPALFGETGNQIAHGRRRGGGSSSRHACRRYAAPPPRRATAPRVPRRLPRCGPRVAAPAWDQRRRAVAVGAPAEARSRQRPPAWTGGRAGVGGVTTDRSIGRGRPSHPRAGAGGRPGPLDTRWVGRVPPLGAGRPGRPSRRRGGSTRRAAAPSRRPRRVGRLRVRGRAAVQMPIAPASGQKHNAAARLPLSRTVVQVVRRHPARGRRRCASSGSGDGFFLALLVVRSVHTEQPLAGGDVNSRSATLKKANGPPDQPTRGKVVTEQQDSPQRKTAGRGAPRRVGSAGREAP